MGTGIVMTRVEHFRPNPKSDPVQIFCIPEPIPVVGGRFRPQNSNKFRLLEEIKIYKGGPLPRKGRFAVEGRFIQCKIGKIDREGGTFS